MMNSFDILHLTHLYGIFLAHILVFFVFSFVYGLLPSLKSNENIYDFPGQIIAVNATNCIRPRQLNGITGTFVICYMIRVDTKQSEVSVLKHVVQEHQIILLLISE